jgi:hypothetical protein
MKFRILAPVALVVFVLLSGCGRKVYQNVDEIYKALIHKGPSDVKRLLGEPDWTFDPRSIGGAVDEGWQYDDRCRGDTTGKPETVTVYFDKGRVVSVVVPDSAF